MKGDFSRDFEVSTDNFAGVLWQQGKVFTDADGNAETRINTHWQDTAGRDVIGAGVAAVPAALPDSFRVVAATLSADQVTVRLQPGRVWADGLLLHLDETPPINRAADYLQPPIQDPPFDASSIADGERDLVVLEVWRESVNAFQIPEELIEPALGGPDTTERLHTASALRLFRLEADDTCESVLDELQDDPSLHGRLSVTLNPPDPLTGDCPVADAGGYTGFEHRLFRIEIADNDGPETLFKWSDSNGGLVGRGTFDAAAQRGAITANLQAITSSGLDSFYLEVLRYDADRGHWQVTYGASVTLNGDNEFVLPATPTFGVVPPPNERVFFRLWNDIADVDAFPAGAADPVELIDGIRLEFDPAASSLYRPRDYWVFSVRAGEIPNPETLIDDEPPQGIRYHRVALAILEWDGSDDLSAAEGTILDCRQIFDPLTRQESCCTYRVGDGLRSHGEFDSIQEAVDALPASGGQVCVLPGLYEENVVIDRRANITISGCGRRSRVVSAEPEEGDAAPVFHVRNSQRVRIEGLAVEAHETGIGVLVETEAPPPREIRRFQPAREIVLTNLFLEAATRSAVEIRFVAEVAITDCHFEMRDRPTVWPALFFLGEDGLIARNVIRVRPRDTSGPLSEETPIRAGAGLGGIQLGGSSERVRLIDNLIQGGNGNGITLGSLETIDANGLVLIAIIGWLINADDPCFPCRPGDLRLPDPVIVNGDDDGRRDVPAGPLVDITIENNRILDMGLNGIGVAGFFNLDAVDEFITVERLLIARNVIRRCLQRPLAPIEDGMVDAMGYGGVSLADVEYLVLRENVIEDNGPDHLQPVCGVFILHGEGVEIRDNRILNNGAKTGEEASGAAQGRRGGINIVYCIAPTVPVVIGQGAYPRQEGTNALMMQGNQVSTNLGRALSVTALGPVMVQGNALTSRGMVLSRDRLDPTFLASTVAIVNIGVSNELYGQLLLFSTMSGGNVSLQRETTATIDTHLTIEREGRPGLDDFRIGQYLANGNVSFTDNQVVLDLLERGVSLSFSSILIMTLDDLAFEDNQCDASLFDDFLLSQAILFGFSSRTSGNRFKEGFFNAFFSAATFGFLNHTANNQATHCMMIRPKPPYPYTFDAGNSIVVTSVFPDLCGTLENILGGYGNTGAATLGSQNG